MLRIGILGDIGSGKSYVARCFGYPVFNADEEVAKLYKKNRRTFKKLKKVLPKYFYKFPINKNQVTTAILANKSNLKTIVKVVHWEIRKKMNIFLNKNRHKRVVVLDIPLLLENKINKKNDILIFVQARRADVLKRLKKRINFNPKLLNKFKSIQLSPGYKKKKSQFIIKNNFTKISVKNSVKKIIKKLNK